MVTYQIFFNVGIINENDWFVPRQVPRVLSTMHLTLIVIALVGAFRSQTMKKKEEEDSGGP